MAWLQYKSNKKYKINRKMLKDKIIEKCVKRILSPLWEFFVKQC